MTLKKTGDSDGKSDNNESNYAQRSNDSHKESSQTTRKKTEKKDTLVLFDIGGILLKMDFATMFRELAAHSSNDTGTLSAKELSARFAKTEIDKHLMRGKGESEYLDDIRAIIDNKKIGDDELMRILKCSIPSQLDEMIIIKERLHKAGYTVGVLSNMSRWGLQYLKEDLPKTVETYGGPAIFSFDAMMLKPEKGIYALATKKHYERVIYFEDKSSYLKYPIEHFGWIGIHLTCYRDLDEPIRHVGEDHQDATHIDGEMHTADSPKQVIDILHKIGLEF